MHVCTCTDAKTLEFGCLNANKQPAYIRKTKQVIFKSTRNSFDISICINQNKQYTFTKKTKNRKSLRKFFDWEQTRGGILQALSNEVGMKSQHVYTIPTL